MTEEDLLEFDDLDTPEQFHLRAEAYKERFVEALQFQPLNLGVMRHIFRQATAYRVRSILPLVLDNFTYLLPVVRDVVNYINKVTTSKIAKRFSSQYQQTIDNPYAVLTYVNVWIYTLFQNQAFNATDIVMDYSKIIRIREQALVACRQRNAQWFKEKKDEIDTFGAWDRRAILHSSHILSLDELRHWYPVVTAKNDLVDSAICAKVISDKNVKKVVKLDSRSPV
jgi:hypothetical protein